MFGEAQVLVCLIHSRMLGEVADRMSTQYGDYDLDQLSDENRRAIRSLHRSVMRYCAKRGYVTAALFLTKDIQCFNSKMSWGLPSDGSDTTIHWSKVDSPDAPERSSTIVFNSIPTPCFG